MANLFQFLFYCDFSYFIRLHFNIPAPILTVCVSGITFGNGIVNLLGQYKNYDVELECPWLKTQDPKTGHDQQ